jgi:hypothetical protein
MLKRLREKGLPEEQCRPFPESAKQAENYAAQVRDYLRKHPDSYHAGGLWETYRNRVDEVLGYYEAVAADSAGRTERRKTTWILILGIVAALAAIAAAFGGVSEIFKVVKPILGVP